MSKEEVFQVVLDLAKGKAPRPYGFPSNFFKIGI